MEGLNIENTQLEVAEIEQDSKRESKLEEAAIAVVNMFRSRLPEAENVVSYLNNRNLEQA